MKSDEPAIGSAGSGPSSQPVEAVDGSLIRTLIRASRKDIGLSLPLIPLYSGAEVVLAFLAAALLRLVYVDAPRVPVAELLPETLRTHLVFPQTVDRKDLAFAVPLLIVAVGLIKLVTSFLSTYLMERAGFRVSTVLREKLLEKMLRAPALKLQSVDASELSNRLMVDTTLMQGAVSKGALSGLRDLCVLIFCLLAMIVVAQNMFLFVVAVVVPFAFGVRFLAREVHRYTRESIDRQVELSTFAMESRRGLLSLFAERLQVLRLRNFLALTQANHSHARRSYVVRTVFGPMIEFLAVLGIAALLAFKNHLGSVDVAGYASLMILAVMTYRPLKNIAGVVSQMAEIRVTLNRIMLLWKDYSGGAAASFDGAVRTALPAKDQARALAEGLCLQAVGLGFTTGDIPLVKGLNCELREGEIAAFVGPSGSGKTTALRLLAGILEPTEGSVQHVGQIVLATQYPYVFEGSVEDNVAYGGASGRQSGQRLEASVVCVEGLGLALSPTTARLFLERSVLTQGDGLSGGEKARVSLARVLSAPADVVLFDEPTANLDAGSAERFWSLLKQRVRRESGTAAVVVTHNEKDLIHCSRVFRFSAGRATEEKPRAQPNGAGSDPVGGSN
jgi:ABC-type multidrug transport system fused ATPase/permease subunit